MISVHLAVKNVEMAMSKTYSKKNKIQLFCFSTEPLKVKYFTRCLAVDPDVVQNYTCNI